MANGKWFRSGHPKTQGSPQKHGEKERGAEILEFALILTGLMVLTLGLISFSRAYNVYQTITRAAREGARVAVLPSSVYDGNTYIGNNGTYTSPDSPIFLNYIKPALEAANLNPNACSSSSQTNCIADYNEQVKWLNPSDTDKQCGIVISFVYPYQLDVPFTTLGLTTLQLHTEVQMRLENANYQQTGSTGVYTLTCP